MEKIIQQYLGDTKISGATNYESLTSKPSINGVELVGDVLLEDLSIASLDDISTVVKSEGTFTNGKIWSGTKAEYDAIVTKDPNTIYYVEDDKPAPLPNTYVDAYELTETLTNKTFLGKKVYRKVVSFIPITTTTSHTRPHGIVNLGDVVNFSGFWTTGETRMPLPFTWNGIPDQIGISVNNTNITVVTGMDRSMAAKMMIVLEYTCTDK